MTNITPFNFNNNEIRTVTNDETGEPWFILADVCKSLELSNPSVVATRLDDDEQCNPKSGLGLRKDQIMINESGLYSVILRSDKPEAKPFKKWITSEVLPAIRKTGSYSVPQPKPPKTVIEAARVFKALKGFAISVGLKGNQAVLSANRATLKCTDINLLELTDQTALIAEKPDALLTPTEIGMRIGGVTARQINTMLEKLNYQISHRDAKNNKHWELTPEGQVFGEALDTGKKHGDGTPIQQIKWYSRVINIMPIHAA